MYLQDETHKQVFLNAKNIKSLSNYINERLAKIKGFSQYGIKATVAENCSDLLSSLFFLSDDVRRIENTGSGIQYIAMVTLNIISQIFNILNNKSNNIDEHLYTRDDGKKIFPLVIALDEPEVHLHPYLQRSLIKYYKNILCNNDSDFLSLLKDLFNIDGLDGQLVIVTHSSDILLDDYRNIIRFYKKNSITRIISGVSLAKTFRDNVEKQLIMHFHELRETFYAHCVIIVEGESEYGCMSYFAEKAGISLDDTCISIINAQGEKSINQ
jgi:putative ATP-dependent endonuclease of OLD family